MSLKYSVDQALTKARSFVKKDKIEEAKSLYQAVLLAFPKNKRAHDELAILNHYRRNNPTNDLSQETVNQLANLYNQGQFVSVVEQALTLIKHYPQAFIIWNFLGAAYKSLGQVEKASEAFKKVTELNPNYADGFNNLGATLSDTGKLKEALEAYNKAISLRPNDATTYFNKGNALKGQDKLDEAIEFYDKAILLKPNYAKAYNNMGAVLRDQVKLEASLDAFNKAVSVDPNYAEAYNNIGEVFRDQGKYDEAIESYNKALSIKPDYAEAYNNIGITLKEQGNINEAIDTFKKVTELNPNYADGFNNLGATLSDTGKLKEALEAYNKAISLRPNDATTYFNKGNALKGQDKLDEAIEFYDKAILLKPNYAKAYNNMGAVLRDQVKLEASLDAFNKAVSVDPNYAEAYNNIGEVFRDQGKYDEAIESYNKALSIKPDYAEAYNNIGFTYKAKGALDEALAAFNISVSIIPNYAEAFCNMSMSLFYTGRIKEGLDKYEWRFKSKKFKPNLRYFSQPRWDGKSSLSDRRILIWCEQGIGDTMNWSSCLSLVSSKAKHCILECQEKLVPLLRRSFPNVEVKPVDRSLDSERDDFDLHLPMGSLYKHFIDDILDNKRSKAYLIPDPERVKFWKERLGSIGKGPYIGVSWKSSVVSAYRLAHYPSVLEWSSVFNVPDVTFINLQYTDFADDIAKVRDEFGVTIHNFNDLDQYANIDDVAALCAALDMVVSTKVTPPMISAGVGTPTKIANWRQSNFNNILNNPNITSFEMFNKDTYETWDNVFQLIANDILKYKEKNNHGY